MDIFAAALCGLNRDARWRLAKSSLYPPEVPPPPAAEPINVGERAEIKGPVR